MFMSGAVPARRPTPALPDAALPASAWAPSSARPPRLPRWSSACDANGTALERSPGRGRRPERRGPRPWPAPCTAPPCPAGRPRTGKPSRLKMDRRRTGQSAGRRERRLLLRQAKTSPPSAPPLRGMRTPHVTPLLDPLAEPLRRGGATRTTHIKNVQRLTSALTAASMENAHSSSDAFSPPPRTPETPEAGKARR